MSLFWIRQFVRVSYRLRVQSGYSYFFKGRVVGVGRRTMGVNNWDIWQLPLWMFDDRRSWMFDELEWMSEMCWPCAWQIRVRNSPRQTAGSKTKKKILIKNYIITNLPQFPLRSMPWPLPFFSIKSESKIVFQIYLFTLVSSQSTRRLMKILIWYSPPPTYESRRIAR